VYHGASLVKTLALGADLTNCARAMMFSLGCIQVMHKHDICSGHCMSRPQRFSD